MEIWKIEVPSKDSVATAWALATTAKEALRLSGCKDAIVTQMPDRLWISPELIVWEAKRRLDPGHVG